MTLIFHATEHAFASATRPPANHLHGGPETGDHAATALSHRSHGLTTINSSCVRASATVLEDVDDPEDRAIGAVKYSQSVMPMAT